eukprot:3023016-Rhodomonas_salina.1
MPATAFLAKTRLEGWLRTLPKTEPESWGGAVDVCAVRLWLDKPTNTPYGLRSDARVVLVRTV